MAFDWGNFASGFGSSGLLQGLVGGFFGGGNPYEDAMNEYRKYSKQASEFQNPFYQAGKGALPKYNEWNESMKDPSAFINNLMGGYQESPHAKYLQDKSIKAAQNYGSASGLTGSTPLTQQIQENAAGISSADQSDWLKNVLGINEKYGSNLGNMVDRGQSAANNLSNIKLGLGQQMGQGAFNSNLYDKQQITDLFEGLSKIVKMFSNLQGQGAGGYY